MISGELFKIITVDVKNKIQELPNLTLMSDEELYDAIEIRMEQKLSELSESDEDELGSVTFRDKNSIKNSVFESIRGLDVLGTIIEDKTITEVMINGYDNIFVEQNGRVKKLRGADRHHHKIRAHGGQKRGREQPYRGYTSCGRLPCKCGAAACGAQWSYRYYKTVPAGSHDYTEAAGLRLPDHGGGCLS